MELLSRAACHVCMEPVACFALPTSPRRQHSRLPIVMIAGALLPFAVVVGALAATTPAQPWYYRPVSPCVQRVPGNDASAAADVCGDLAYALQACWDGGDGGDVRAAVNQLDLYIVGHDRDPSSVVDWYPVHRAHCQLRGPPERRCAHAFLSSDRAPFEALIDGSDPTAIVSAFAERLPPLHGPDLNRQVLWWLGYARAQLRIGDLDGAASSLKRVAPHTGYPTNPWRSAYSAIEKDLQKPRRSHAGIPSPTAIR